MFRVIAVVALAAAAIVLATAGSAVTSEPAPVQEGTRPVLFVANNWDGTADIVDPDDFRILGRLNVIPDIEERMAEINSDPERLGYFIAIRHLVGEGHDQFVDDMFSSHDGRVVYISRPSLADVVAIDLNTKEIVWRFVMEGQRTDHMAISPDGTRLVVSDSSITKVQILDTATGKKVGEFESGVTPHENNYSEDGSRIFHASIGRVYTPTDQPAMDASKGERYFQVVDASTNQILKRLDIGQILEANGHPDMSSAVRPMAIAPDENIFYFQLSFHHGFVVFDLAQEKPLHVVDLPKKTTEPRENYLLDSAHHGLAINPDGTKLCAAGTMDGYAAIVSTADFSHTLIEPVDKPYWSTNSGDGRYCFVSASGADEVVVIDYATEREVARIPVGDHPQRMRMGVIRSEYVGEPPTAQPEAGAPARLEVLSARVRRRMLDLRLRIDARASGRVKVAYGKRMRFWTRIPDGKGEAVTWRVRRRLARGHRRGQLVDLRFKGGDRLAPARVRLRTGRRAPHLRVRRARMDDRGRLTVAGRIARRARGRVHVRLSRARMRPLDYRARIRDGRWRLRALLPSKAAASGGHLSVVYRGHRRLSIRGEQETLRVRP